MNFLNPISLLICIVLLTFQCCNTPSKALDCRDLGKSNKKKFAKSVTVDKGGHGDFTTIQAAINCVPDKNDHWLHIKVSPGVYIEKVEIPVKKRYIFLEGAGANFTSIEWADYVATSNSSTFTSYADNIVVKGITFKNSHNLGINTHQASWSQAVAARIKGDKCAFIECAFIGVEDTLWDEKQRHYFYGCYIEGALDFIFGKAQSIYEKCVVSVNIGKYAAGGIGCMTAHKKEWPGDKSGFVFKSCKFTGIGKAYLGRAWGPYSTVVIYASLLSDVVDPRGWNAWHFVHHEANFTYVEANNIGPGADKSKRVPWEKKLNSSELAHFVDDSYINSDGWLHKLPIRPSP